MGKKCLVKTDKGGFTLAWERHASRTRSGIWADVLKKKKSWYLLSKQTGSRKKISAENKAFSDDCKH